MNTLKTQSNLFFIYPLIGPDHICQIHLSVLQLLIGPLHICDIRLLAQSTKVPLAFQQTTNSDFNPSGQPHQGRTSKRFCNLTKQQHQLVKNLQGPFLILCLLKKSVCVCSQVFKLRDRCDGCLYICTQLLSSIQLQANNSPNSPDLLLLEQQPKSHVLGKEIFLQV